MLQAQCTTTGFDICNPVTAVVSDFRNAVQINNTGAPLTAGAKYKFSNAIPSLYLDAVISIDAMVNATMAGANAPTIDDDNAADESGVPGTQMDLFAPRIAPDQALSCTDKWGYVEFTVKFYTHYNGNGAPLPGSEIAVSNLNFLHFDIDGFKQSNDGWFKETGYIKVVGTNPVNFRSSSTELNSYNSNNEWLLTFGSATDRIGITRCSEVIEKSIYAAPQNFISFRMGYDYKAPSGNCNNLNIQPTRDYGSRFACFNLPAGGPLPVSFTNLAVNYNSGICNISWTSLQEHNLNSYEIQRSFDGINFEFAGNIKANNLTSLQQYHFTDNAASFSSKYIYYRIRIIDQDQSMKLSNIVSVKIADWKNNEITIAPNPSNNSAQIKIKLQKNTPGYISVIDAAGKTVLYQKATLLAGNNTIVINNITTLSEGYYLVRLIANDEIFTSKLLVSK